MTDMLTRQFLTVREVGDLLKVGEVSVRHWIRGGELRAIDIGREWRIAPSDLEHFLLCRASLPRRVGVTVGVGSRYCAGAVPRRSGPRRRSFVRRRAPREDVDPRYRNRGEGGRMTRPIVCAVTAASRRRPGGFRGVARSGGAEDLTAPGGLQTPDLPGARLGLGDHHPGRGRAVRDCGGGGVGRDRKWAGRAASVRLT